MASKSRMRVEDYTVVWICGLPIETVAAIGMLDERHQPLPQASNDENTYILGTIEAHNVVVACLPVGTMGITSMVRVASYAFQTFPSLRFVLTIGIGGGVPSLSHDIRLGDVVVGVPRGPNGGVIQYDLRKTSSGHGLRQIGSLSRPPSVLLSALSTLQARHLMEEPALSKYLFELTMSNSKLESMFAYPSENDNLFESDYTHDPMNPTCSSCDTTKLVHRPPRDSEEPFIHYGLIASGNIPIKDAKIRDRLQRDLDVLCVEMEAAGLPDSFPCLVIRGISDYADSHKNKSWQAYAAATAAAFAKELLSVLPPSQVVASRSIVPKKSRTVDDLLNMKDRVFSVYRKRNLNFVGRKDIISEIEETLQEQYCVSLCGIAAIGKSEVALEYAYRFRAKKPESHILWIDASSLTRFRQGCYDIARKLRLTISEDREFDACQAVFNWLQRENENWLLILDEAENWDASTPDETLALENESLADYLPTSLSHNRLLIVTTRRQTLGFALTHAKSNASKILIHVPELLPTDAVDLLRLQLRNSTEAHFDDLSEQLVKVLGFHPLAIILAAESMNTRGLTLRKYLRAYHTVGGKIDASQARDSLTPLFRTLEISVDQVRKEEPGAADLLSTLVMLQTQEIPTHLLKPSETSDLSPQMELEILMDMALINANPDQDAFNIPTTVHLAVRRSIETSNQEQYFRERASNLVADRFPIASLDSKQLCESLMPIAQIVLRYEVDSLTALKSQARLLSKIGAFELQVGDVDNAIAHMTQAYEIVDQSLDEQELKWLTMSILAEALYSVGKYSKAELMFRKMLEFKESSLGPLHTDTIKVKSNLGVILQFQGQFTEAKELLQEALRGYQQILGYENPETLATMSNLGSVLSNIGKYEEAEHLFRQTLESCQKVLGDDHPDTLASMTNLVSALSQQGKDEEALDWAREAFNNSERVLGESHSDTLLSMKNLTTVLINLGDFDDAVQVSSRALEVCQNASGKAHKSTIRTMDLLATALQAQGNLRSAEELYLEAWETSQDAFGYADKESLESLVFFINFLQQQNRLQELSELLQKVCADLASILGANHPTAIEFQKLLTQISQEKENPKSSQPKAEHPAGLMLQNLTLDMDSDLIKSPKEPNAIHAREAIGRDGHRRMPNSAKVF